MVHLKPYPRYLYAVTFVWFACLAGGFVAPFLQAEAELSDGLVGSVLAAQWFITGIVGTGGGAVADRYELRHPGRGRIAVMSAGILLGTVAFLLHGVHHVLPGLPILNHVLFHAALRGVFAVSNALGGPVLDGLTISFLEESPDLAKEDYGKERLWGGVFWGLGNVMIGMLADIFGFKAMYATALVSGLSCLLVLHWFSNELVAFRAAHTNSGSDRDAAESTEDTRLIPQSRDETENEPQTRLLSSCAILATIFSSLYGVGFVTSFFTLNMGTNIVEGLIFTWFRQIGASWTFCGLTVVLTVMFEIPLFHMSPQLLRKNGPGVLQEVAGLAYVVRAIGYSLIPEGNILYILFLEPLHGVTYAFSMTSAVDFMARRLPPEQAAAGQGWVFTGRSFGAVVGLLGGGWFQELYGGRFMYRLFAGIVFAGMVVYGVANKVDGEKKRRFLPHASGSSEERDAIEAESFEIST